MLCQCKFLHNPDSVPIRSLRKLQKALKVAVINGTVRQCRLSKAPAIMTSLKQPVYLGRSMSDPHEDSFSCFVNVAHYLHLMISFRCTRLIYAERVHPNIPCPTHLMELLQEVEEIRPYEHLFLVDGDGRLVSSRAPSV